MVKLIVGHRVRYAVTDCAAGHVQSLDTTVQQTNQLEPANTGILTCVLSKALRLAKVIGSGAIVRLQNIDDVAHLIFPDNQEIRIHRFHFRVLLIRDAQRPGLPRWIAEPADIVRSAALGLKDGLLPIVQIDDGLAGRIVHKQMVGICLADIAALNADGFRQAEIVLTDNIAVRNNAVVLLAIALGQACDTATVGVVDVVEPTAGIVMEPVHAVRIGSEDYDVNFVSRRIIVIAVFISIPVSDALVTQLEFRKAELPVEVGVCGGEQIHLRMVIHRLAEHIKCLRLQFELQNLRGQLVVFAFI